MVAGCKHGAPDNTRPSLAAATEADPSAGNDVQDDEASTEPTSRLGSDPLGDLDGPRPPDPGASSGEEDVARPAVQCECAAPRRLLPSDVIEGAAVAEATKQLSGARETPIDWRNGAWSATTPKATRLFARLSNIVAVEVTCGPGSPEPLACNAGRFFTANLSLQTSDHLLDLHAPVRVDYSGTAGVVRLDLDHAPPTLSRLLVAGTTRLHGMLYWHARPAGDLVVLDAHGSWQPLAVLAAQKP